LLNQLCKSATFYLIGLLVATCRKGRRGQNGNKSYGGFLASKYLLRWKGGLWGSVPTNSPSLFKTMKTYDNITIKEEKDNVILTTPSMTKPLIIPHDIWRAIVADNVKKVMRGNDNITESVDSTTL